MPASALAAGAVFFGTASAQLLAVGAGKSCSGSSRTATTARPVTSVVDRLRFGAGVLDRRTTVGMAVMDAADWDARYREAELLWSAEPNRWVAQCAQQLAPGRALDLAAGEGRNALWLAARGWVVTAVDFSRVAVDRARELSEELPTSAADQMQWVVGDVLEYEPCGTFDLVLISYLHLPAQQRRFVVRKAAAALADSGTLLVVGHHADNLVDGVGGPQDPTVLYSEQDVVDDVADVPGLQVRTAAKVERPVAGEARPALDVVVEIRREGQ